LEAGRNFYELYGMLALARDQRAVLPLLQRFVAAPKGEKDDATYALAAIARRIGRPALRAEFAKAATPEDRANLPDKMAESFWSVAEEDIHDHFQLFYGGF
jgi:hypothetical protein